MIPYELNKTVSAKVKTYLYFQPVWFCRKSYLNKEIFAPTANETQKVF